MPPITSSKTAGKARYSFPIIGGISERLQITLDVSALDGTGLVDANGVLKPGGPLRRATKVLTPVSGITQVVLGVTFEEVKVAKSNSTADLTAATDIPVVVAVSATIDRAIVENNLGRVLSADEVSAINANDRLSLTDPV